MKRVLLLFCQGFEVYEAAAFYDVLGWTKEYGAEKIAVTTVGLEKEVRGSFGIRIVPDMLLADVKPEEFAALAVPGGFEIHGFYKDAYSEPVARLINSFHEMGKPISSICVGALPLAYSGILQGRAATTYHLGDGRRRKQLADFGVTVVDQPMVRDGHVVTSTSPATALDVAFALLTTLTSQKNSDHIRYLMGFVAPDQEELK